MPESTHVLLEYSYRDASNYSAHGALLLRGQLDRQEVEAIENSLEAGEFFIAEQVDIPPLYEHLWRYSDGPNSDDHTWHTYRGIRPARLEEIQDHPDQGSIGDLAERFRRVATWNLRLSAHWNG